jgi:diguanylate cyclase (GGDEF)-like protein
MTEGKPIRALLVENDAEDAAILSRYILKMKTCAVNLTHSASAEEASAALAAEPFDLVFLDLELGGSDSGVEVLERMRSDDLDVPVIVVTGSGDESKAVVAMKAGAYDYLVKDTLTVDTLERAVRYASRRHLLEQERKRVVEKLAELSVTDELTGLANRRHLMRKLEEEARRSARTGRPFALLMIDLDHFKDVNDRHGHQIGDHVLKQCAAVLLENLRRTDFVGRYGGEEFCVMLPEASAEGATHVAEKLRQAVDGLSSPVPTISVGVALSQGCSSVEEVVRRADEALYRAKEAGRNRAVLYGHP